jgi:hypothetical protein
VLRSSSLTSWQQHALDLAIEACRTVAPLVARSPAARQELEETGHEDALCWLEGRPLSPLAELIPHLERRAITAGLANAEIPPPWGTPPGELLERLTQLEEKARVALRMYARVASPLLFVKQEPATKRPSSTASPVAQPPPGPGPQRATPPRSEETLPRPAEAVHRRAREQLARMKTALAEARQDDPTHLAPSIEGLVPRRPAREAPEEPTSALRLSLHGPSPREYRRLGAGSEVAVFAPGTRLVVKASAPVSPGVATRSRSAMTLLVTSENEAHELTWPEGDEVDFAVLDELEPGAYRLDLVDRTGERPAQLYFLVEDCKPTLPRMVAHVVLGGIELPWEGHHALDVVRLGEEQLALRLPPLWPVRLFWRDVSRRSLGRCFADKQGVLDLSERVASMRHRQATTTVADLEIDAGDLGILTLRYERPSGADDVLARLLELARERAAHLPQGSLEVLRTIWVEPICKALGYLVSKPQKQHKEGPLLQEISMLMRSGAQIVRLPYAALWLSTAPPSLEECHHEMKSGGPSRILWTDGCRWGRAELGRRHFEWITALTFPIGAPAEAAPSVRSSFRALVERLGV